MTAPSPAGVTLRLRVVDDADFARAAADVVAGSIRAHPAGTLGVATGRTPETVYAALATAGLDASALRLAALDEYVGIDRDDPRSYRAYVTDRIASPLGVPENQVLLPSIDPDGAVTYDARLAAIGGVDLQIVGIGRNGHLGFNEPGSPLDSVSRIVELAATTRADNAEFFGGDPDAVPTHAITQGLATILRARQILLLARGDAKHEALRAALTGPVTENLPASALQHHPNVLVLADQAAAGDLA